jgi:hypothetical protein
MSWFLYSSDVPLSDTVLPSLATEDGEHIAFTALFVDAPVSSPDGIPAAFVRQ